MNPQPAITPKAAPAAKPAARPTILSVDHIKRAIGDANFYTLMPEFLAVKRKMDAMHVNFNTGCSPCKKRRVATSLTSDFVSILTNMSDDGLGRMKKYLGVNKLLVRSVNKQTGKMEMKEI